MDEIDIKLESKEVKGKIVKTDWTIIETPYMIFAEYGKPERKIWHRSKWKIFLYYAYKYTRIKWFLKQYQK